MDITELQQLIIRRSQLLTAIAEKETYRQMLAKQIQEKIDASIPSELKQQLADLNAEFSTADLSEQAEALRSTIEMGVLKNGATVKVEGVGQAIFNKGRVSWDTKGLDGLTVALPQLVQFRKTGEPFITFR